MLAFAIVVFVIDSLRKKGAEEMKSKTKQTSRQLRLLSYNELRA